MRLREIKLTRFEEKSLQCQGLCEDLLLMDAYCVNQSRIINIINTIELEGDTEEYLDDIIPELQDMICDAEAEIEEREESENIINSRLRLEDRYA